MRRQARFAAVAAWLLCLAASAGAAPSWSLTASVGEASGASALDAALLFLGQEDHVASTSAPSALFHLTAEHLRVESDHTNLSLAAAARGNVLPTTTSRDYVQATVQGVDVRDTNYRFLVFPLPDSEPPTIHATSSQCMRFEPSDAERIEREARVQDFREPLVADVDETLRWTDCTPASPSIHGDFLLVLWEWDAQLQSGDETVELPSGRQGAADVEAARDAAGPATERYLYAYNATLTIPALAGPHRVYVEKASVETTQVKLVAARGRITHAGEVMDLKGSEVVVRGRIQLELDGTGAGQALAAQVEGDVEELRVDGQGMMGAKVDGRGFWSWGPWMWGLLPLVGAVGGGTVVVRRVGWGRARRVEHLDARLQDLFQREDHAAALRCSEQLLRLEPDHAEARVLRALCLGNLGQLSQAHEAHKQTHWRLQLISDGEAERWIAENAYQAARVCMDLRSRADEESVRDELHQSALQWLQTAFTIDGGHYRQEAQMEPDFGPILRDVMMLAEQIGGASEWMQP